MKQLVITVMRLVGYRVKANCPLVGPGPVGRAPSIAAIKFLKKLVMLIILCN